MPQMQTLFQTPTIPPLENGQSKRTSPERSTLKGMEKCEYELQEKLVRFKDISLLKSSLLPKDEEQNSAFELFEFYGDAVLYERVTSTLLQSRRFMSPGFLTKIRSHCVCNANLALCFKNLKMLNLLSQSQYPTNVKEQGDIVESIIGELSDRLTNNDSNEVIDAVVVKNFIRDLISYIIYRGEEEYFKSNPQSSTPKRTSPSKTPPQISPPKKAPSPAKQPPPALIPPTSIVKQPPPALIPPTSIVKQPLPALIPSNPVVKQAPPPSKQTSTKAIKQTSPKKQANLNLPTILQTPSLPSNPDLIVPGLLLMPATPMNPLESSNSPRPSQIPSPTSDFLLVPESFNN